MENTKNAKKNRNFNMTINVVFQQEALSVFNEGAKQSLENSTRSMNDFVKALRAKVNNPPTQKI